MQAAEACHTAGAVHTTRALVVFRCDVATALPLSTLCMAASRCCTVLSSAPLHAFGVKGVVEELLKGIEVKLGAGEGIGTQRLAQDPAVASGKQRRGVWKPWQRCYPPWKSIVPSACMQGF